MSNRQTPEKLDVVPSALFFLALALILMSSCAPSVPVSTVPPAPAPQQEPPPIYVEPKAPEPPPATPPSSKSADEAPVGFEFVKRLVVPGNVNWTDVGFDVEEGEEFYLKASGGISLQRGNPTAFCGPDGYNLSSAQQPIPEKNIGALVGRVVMLISVEVDKESGKEIRKERIEYFFAGTEARVRIALGGRLYLGINENVVGDNSGEFAVLVFRKPLF